VRRTLPSHLSSKRAELMQSPPRRGRVQYAARAVMLLFTAFVTL
jgi:hypothetical protein